jgi:hypothetical protein
VCPMSTLRVPLSSAADKLEAEHRAVQKTHLVQYRSAS